MRILLWLSGEHPSMPRAEALAAFDAARSSATVVQERPRLLVMDTTGDEEETIRTVSRLGLTHDVSEFLFSSEWDPSRLKPAADKATLATRVSFAVRADRLGERGPRRTTAEKEIGALLAEGRRVDLADPQSIIRCFIDDDYVWVGRRLWDRDPKETARRHVKHRPVGSSVSLPPKTARALLNLALIPPGGTVYDPFCGTGGVLLEGAAMGLRVLGSDLDPHMVEASRRNLIHYGLPAPDLFQADVGDTPRILRERGTASLDGIVTDLPYGRSASTGKEALTKLYDRAFLAIRDVLPRGARAVIGLPTEAAAKRAQEFLDPVDLFKVWVHRSLTRHFVVLRKPTA